MKKLLIICPLAFLLFSCENLNTSLPGTDTAQYTSSNTVTFPKGTKAVDIYNTVFPLFPKDEYHAVNGGWKYIKTETDADGLVNQSWETVPFSKIKHAHTTTDPQINTHTVYLWTDDNNIKEIVFEWQRQTTNIWKNEPIEGDITFTF